MINRIAKILSANDTGDTGAHQCGVHIPKQEDFLLFFPSLDSKLRNPRCEIAFIDESSVCWQLSYIHYNNKYFGGSRNEYRLTKMTKYFKKFNLRPGDEIILSKENDRYSIICRKHTNPQRNVSGVLALGSNWRVVKI